MGDLIYFPALPDREWAQYESIFRDLLKKEGFGFAAIETICESLEIRIKRISRNFYKEDSVPIPAQYELAVGRAVAVRNEAMNLALLEIFLMEKDLYILRNP